MSITETFGLDGYEDDCSTMPNCIARWNARVSREAGGCYVYGYRAEDSIFYIGKGSGRRAWTQAGHAHPRFHTYVTAMLSEPYSVEILRDQLREEDAEELEQVLVRCFHHQLVNHVHGAEVIPSRLAAGTGAKDVVENGRMAETQRQWTDAVAHYRNYLAFISLQEQQQDDRELAALRMAAGTQLAARVDLHERTHLYKPCAPVQACEALSRLTHCLCKLGQAEEARDEILAFQRRYPHGSFLPWDTFVPRLGKTDTVSVSQREQATLKRVERALRRTTAGSSSQGLFERR